MQVDIPAIGVSKKCCYMCHLLWKCLFKGSYSSSLHGCSGLKFSDAPSEYMPNTHGHMVPWDPPLFGIPDEVMGELVSTLIKEVIRVASIVGEKTDDESRQSSPQSNTSSLPAVATKNNKVFRFRKGSRRH